MSSDSFEISPSPAGRKLAGPEFFYSNLHIQETLTTIKYGIEARKGLTIITGAPGIGKSTLLRKTATELASSTICVFESDPRVPFSDILRLILRNLDGDQTDEDESAMVRSCRLQLRSRLDRGQIVALFLDNAHQFPDQTLRSITQAFLAGSAEDPEGTLLQVILAGRAELKTKISQATLTSIRRRRPIVCELQPLNSGEIGAFIEKGLRTSDRPAGIFDERAIKRIALYANGNPGMVNSICERALQLTGGSIDATIPAELIETAAGELDLRRFDNSSESEIFSPSSNTVKFDAPKPSEKFDNDHDIPYRFLADEGISNAPIFPSHAEADGVDWPPRKQRTTAWLRGLSLSVILVGAAAMIGTDNLHNIVRNGIATLHRSAAPYFQSSAQPEIPGQIPPETAIKTEPLAPLPGPDRPSEIQQDSPAPAAGKNAPPAASSPENLFAGRQGRTQAKTAPPAKKERAPATKVTSGPERQDLQTQISRAIENRAIMGVEVSVVQGTAFLDGQVATERQRRAAERAARSVAGVERVRNRIAITFG
jgi:type II secretory pathway predicted ATPase ExeA